MALPSSGPISLGQIQTEFGGSAPTAISEYYGKASGIPSSGAISLGNFHGKSALAKVTINRTESTKSTFNLYDWLNSHYAGKIPKVIEITLTGVFVGNPSNPTRYDGAYHQSYGGVGFLIDSRMSGISLTIINTAVISGGGGNGYGFYENNNNKYLGGFGGNGLETSVPFSLINKGTIQGGGGGGGGGYGTGTKPGGGGAGFGVIGHARNNDQRFIASPGTLHSGGLGGDSTREDNRGGNPAVNGWYDGKNDLKSNQMNGAGGLAIKGIGHINLTNQGKLIGNNS